VKTIPTVANAPQRAVGCAADDRLRADSLPSDRAAPRLHDHGVRHVQPLSDLQIVSRRGSAVHATGLRGRSTMRSISHVTLAVAVLPSQSSPVRAWRRYLQRRWHRADAHLVVVSVTGALICGSYQPTGEMHRRFRGWRTEDGDKSHRDAEDDSFLCASVPPCPMSRPQIRSRRGSVISLSVYTDVPAASARPQVTPMRVVIS
jgi:hypothetical protein